MGFTLLRRPFIVFLSLLFSGCLVSERTSYRITLDADGKSGTFTTTMEHVESDSPDTVSAEKDFQTLIGNWKGKQYLFDAMEKGLYVTERSLQMKNGVLEWRERSIFPDISRFVPEFSPNEPLKFPVSDTSDQKIITNGKLTRLNDSLFIVWPPHTKDFQMKTIRKSFMPKSNFASRFEEYLKGK